MIKLLYKTASYFPTIIQVYLYLINKFGFNLNAIDDAFICNL